MPLLSLPTRVIVLGCMALCTVSIITHNVAGAVLDHRDKVALQAALDRNCPRSPAMVSDALRLDQVRAGERGRSVVFCFTLMSDRADEVTHDRWKGMMGEIWNAARDNEVLRPLFENGVTVVYQYAGSDGRPIGSLTMTPQDML